MDALKGGPKLIAAIGAGAWLTVRAATGMGRRIIAGDALAQRQLADGLPLHVWRPLRTLLPLAALAGIIAGIGAARLLALYNAQIPVLGALAEILLRDIVPLLVGLFACGSVSVALSSRLGAMALNREIDALEALGRDPVAHALGPALAAVLLSAPIHMLLGGIAAVIGCGVPLALIANVGWPLWSGFAFSHDAAGAMLTGMAKLLVYALIAFGVGSAVGAKPVRSPADIGRRATTAFTAGLLGIFSAAALWTALL
ncbi:ABC transporter permease [Sphingobium sp. AR-3-1]|uniref:ABC transporter permease n=1 Tax=Sphingobium psychrophilum TaxID=2728834 RepID=A0A7X9ZSK5_9SPHN|nr:ABC transporter permease [Sphingobium psychrophilum]NML11110.1 ABC transporter permease [Sphingobium psychrophilum]